MLHEKTIHDLYNNYYDDEIRIKNLRLYEKSDSEILRYRYI